MGCSVSNAAPLAHEARNAHCCEGRVIENAEHSTRGHGRLAGLTALVTDADSALGRATAMALAREGADIALAHSGESQDVARCRQEIEKCGRHALAFEADLLTQQGRAQFIERVSREVSRIDTLVVNTAYNWLHTTPANADEPERERLFRTSLEAALQVSLTISSQIVEGGSIVLTAPMRYAHPIEPARALAANGRAIQSTTASLASRLAAKRIRVNAIVPGPLQEPRLLAQLPESTRARFGCETLFGCAALPEEIAPAFVYLAAAGESGFVNAATLEVTGGASAPNSAFE
jgi:NAD(P)-dependent dehydrogenase (short-subunit alcohol dehydrogenase family)